MQFDALNPKMVRRIPEAGITQGHTKTVGKGMIIIAAQNSNTVKTSFFIWKIAC
jgi:hypothetical protein